MSNAPTPSPQSAPDAEQATALPAYRVERHENDASKVLLIVPGPDTFYYDEKPGEDEHAIDLAAARRLWGELGAALGVASNGSEISDEAQHYANVAGCAVERAVSRILGPCPAKCDRGQLPCDCPRCNWFDEAAELRAALLAPYDPPSVVAAPQPMQPPDGYDAAQFVPAPDPESACSDSPEVLVETEDGDWMVLCYEWPDPVPDGPNWQGPAPPQWAETGGFGARFRPTVLRWWPLPGGASCDVEVVPLPPDAMPGGGAAGEGDEGGS